MPDGMTDDEALYSAMSAHTGMSPADVIEQQLRLDYGPDWSRFLAMNYPPEAAGD